MTITIILAIAICCAFALLLIFFASDYGSGELKENYLVYIIILINLIIMTNLMTNCFAKDSLSATNGNENLAICTETEYENSK